MKADGLSDAEVRESAEALDWKRLARHLRGLRLDAPGADTVRRLVLRSAVLVERYPQPHRRARRDAFLHGLGAWIGAVGGEALSAQWQADLEALGLAERGYAAIRDAPVAAMPGDLRASALLSLGAHDVNAVMAAIHARATATKVAEPMSFALEHGDGGHYSGDHIVAGVDASTGAALQLWAQREGWGAADDAIVLPPLVPVDDTHRGEVREVARLAEAWGFWQGLEERRRYDGGDLRLAEAGGEALVTYRPPPDAVAWERITVAAYERLNADIYSIFHELLLRTDARRLAVGIEGPAALLPAAHISLSELESARALDWLVSTEIEVETTRYLGLRLVEWLRGYSVLSAMAQARLDPVAPDRLVWSVTPAALRADLERLGLDRAAAERFIDLATYRRSSADVIDEPLLRTADGRLVVF